MARNFLDTKSSRNGKPFRESACQKGVFDKEVSSPSDAASQISNLNRGNFALGETAKLAKFCVYGHPRQFPLIFIEQKKLLFLIARFTGSHGAELSGYKILRISGLGSCKKRFLALENDFSDAKIVPAPPYSRRFCRFSKSSKSVGFSRFGNLKRLQPAAGDNESAKGLRPSRALLGLFDILPPRSISNAAAER